MKLDVQFRGILVFSFFGQAILVCSEFTSIMRAQKVIGRVANSGVGKLRVGIAVDPYLIRSVSTRIRKRAAQRKAGTCGRLAAIWALRLGTRESQIGGADGRAAQA